MDEVIKVGKNLKDSKAVGGDILTKILKECEFTFDINNYMYKQSNWNWKFSW